MKDYEISEALADLAWKVADGETVEHFATNVAKEIGVDNERVIEIIRRQDPNKIQRDTLMTDVLNA